MRIAFVVPGFASDEDDTCIPVLVDVFKALQPRADVFVLSLRHPGAALRYRVHGFDVRALGGGMRTGAKRIPLLVSAVRALRAEHRRQPFSLVHGLWADEPGAVAVWAARVLGLPAVVSVMGGEMVALPEIEYGGALSRLNRALTGFALSRADVVTAAAGAAADGVRQHLSPEPADRVMRLPFGIDPTIFQTADPPATLAGSLRILQVGSLAQVKGWPLLLHAARRARVNVPGLHVHFVGDGPDAGAIIALADTLGMLDSVTLHGPVKRRRLAGYYRASHILAVTSHHEMQPVVALEGGLHGLPVVGTPVGMLVDLAPEAAIVVPPGDVQGLADALASLAREPERRTKAAALRDRVNREFLADQTAVQLLNLYHRLAQAPRGQTHRRRSRDVTENVVKNVSQRG